MDIQRIISLSESIKRDYESQSNGTMRWLQDYRKEVKAFKEYRGREVFELLQNADDARSDTVVISIDTDNNVLTIENSGEDTQLFNYDGIKSSLLSDISPKAGTAMIGEMGLGFRSVLNWADRIEIRSDDLSAKFDGEVARRYWDQLKGKIADPEKYEAEARRNGREVPLAILALPQIERIVPADIKTTSIILTYDESKVEESILRNLETFQPEFLLFLKHVTRIVIKISGKPDRILTKEKCDERDGICTYRVNNSIWAVSSESTLMDKSVCEASCAFCLDAPQDSYNIYTYFPTKVDFPFPCILHASLELDSSRNSLLPDNQVNREVISHLAGRIKAVADYLKSNRHDWYPYLLMRPDAAQVHKNEYVQQLVNEVRGLSEGGEYVPVFDGGWACENACYHYTDELFAFFNEDSEAKSIFSRLRLPGAPEYARLDAFDPDAAAHVNAYFECLANERNLDRIAQAVKLLHACNPSHNHKFNVLIDDNFNIIRTGEENSAYINTGLTVEGIPAFRLISYVNRDLLSELLKLFEKSGEHKERELADELKKITYVLASDISAITGKLLPKRSDENLSDIEKEELLKCLFKLYLKRDKVIDQETIKRYKPCLPSEDGQWSETSSLVLLDKRFPDGFNHLEGIKPIYGPQDGAAYPAYLMDIEGAMPEDIEAFYVSLGVSKYLKYKRVIFADDQDYVRELMSLSEPKLPDDFSFNCKHERVREEFNVALVADDECFENLNLNETLTLILRSGYKVEAVRSQRVSWFHRRRFDENVSLSYAAYRLKKIPCFKALQNYVIDDGCWLPGTLNEPLAVGSEYSEKDLLKALGAKMNLSEFTAGELYASLNRIADLFEKGLLEEGRIIEYYLAIIKALDANNAQYSPDQGPLRLICKKDGRCEVMDSTQVYYSDNNEFPLEVRRTLPMLLMRSRQGEKKIQNILGCKTLKEIEVLIDVKTDNVELTRELSRHLEERKAYFLAFASFGVGKRGSKSEVLFNEEYKSAISAFNVKVLCDVTCRYGADKAPVQMKDEGELLVAYDACHVCSDARSLREAMANPRFNSSVIEALCLKLRLQGFELTDKFYRILTSGERELQYYRQQEVDDALWTQCQSQFDYTAEDLEFWKKVFAEQKLALDHDGLKKDRGLYIADALQIIHDRSQNVRSFIAYHRQELKACREKYKEQYFHYLYQQLLPDASRHAEYHTLKLQYNDDRWIEDLLNDNGNIYRVNLDYDAMIRAAVLERFGCELPVQDAVSHDQVERYLGGMAVFDLSDEDRGLLYFEGYDGHFDKLRHENSDEKQSDGAVPQTRICAIVEDRFSAPRTLGLHNQEPAGRAHRTRGRRNMSDKRKQQLGNSAEDAVYNSLMASEEYEIGCVYSSYLAKTDLGDDSKGYDLEYRKKGETLSRCLEIKHFDGSSIILSANEFRVANSEEYRDRYDIALYDGKNITIVRNPFADDQKFDIQANQYTVRFALEGNS